MTKPSKLPYVASLSGGLSNVKLSSRADADLNVKSEVLAVQ
jgi:hypothetical protein